MKYIDFVKGQKLSADWLMQSISLMGNKGAGKTYSILRLMEVAAKHAVQCVAIDIAAKLWAIRLKANGKTPSGLKFYIFGGKRADYPVLPHQGAVIARAIVARKLHAVLDLSLMSKGKRRTFLADFLEEFHLQRKHLNDPNPCVLFCEEAHAIAPQKPQPNEAQKILELTLELAKRPREGKTVTKTVEKKVPYVPKKVVNAFNRLSESMSAIAQDMGKLREELLRVPDSGLELREPASIGQLPASVGQLVHQPGPTKVLHDGRARARTRSCDVRSTSKPFQAGASTPRSPANSPPTRRSSSPPSSSATRCS